MAQLLYSLLILPYLLMGLSQCRAAPLLDMTYPLGPETMRFPGVTKFHFSMEHKGPFGPLNQYIEYNDFESCEHLGTHIDAPHHFVKGKTHWYLADIPVDRFVGPAVVIDISGRAATDKDTGVTVKDLQAWEEKHGKIPKGAIVLMNSGWGQYINNVTLFRGNDTDDTRYLHFPGFYPEAAQWLVDNRDIYGVGVDTLSLDRGQRLDYKSHVIFGENNIWGLEMVANVDKLPVKGALLYVSPMKIVNGTGGATRIFAVTDGYTSKGVAGVHVTHALAMVLLSLIACVL